MSGVKFYFKDGTWTDDVQMWSLVMEGPDFYRRVRQTNLPGGVRVSTVFLGLDHSFSETGPPILWETMVFPMSWREEYQQRYTTERAARRGHWRAVWWSVCRWPQLMRAAKKYAKELAQQRAIIARLKQEQDANENM